MKKNNIYLSLIAGKIVACWDSVVLETVSCLREGDHNEEYYWIWYRKKKRRWWRWRWRGRGRRQLAYNTSNGDFWKRQGGASVLKYVYRRKGEGEEGDEESNEGNNRKE